MKSNAMDETCSIYGVTEKYVKNFGRKTSRKGPLERPRRNGRIILKRIEVKTL
jgi:hypothetical protein